MEVTGFPGTLSPLQRDLLRAFDRFAEGFFLTGGAALSGFYGSVRPTRDLDLFSRDPELFAAGREALKAAAGELGCEVQPVRSFPHFQRFLVPRAAEQVVVDLVREDVAAVYPPTVPEGWNLAVDQAEEIAVNKICALVGRGEVRDLADLAFLAHRGISLGQALKDASLKDGGVGPDTVILSLRAFPTLNDDSGLAEFRDQWMRVLRQELLPP